MFTFFSLHENRDGHFAGLMEAKPEELGKICSNRKDVTLYVRQFCILAGLMEAKPEEIGKICPDRIDVPFYVLQFCIHENFLSVQSLRRYEFFKK